MLITDKCPPDLREALDSAREACRNALADYRAGLLDADEVRHALLRWGLVQRPDAAWLLDLRGGRWWRYDGVALGETNSSDLLDPAMVRLRAVVEELMNDEVSVARKGDRS